MLRNGAHRKVAQRKYTLVAIDGDRLYFSNSDERIGYKISRSGKDMESYIVKFNDRKLYEWAETHAGDYDLEFDDELNYWYVDTSY